MTSSARSAASTLHFVVREESADEAGLVDLVVQAAFIDHPISRQTEHLILQRLREAGALSLSLVATLDARVVGHLAFSAVTISGVDAGWWGLGPMAVLPSQQQSGIGSALIRSGLRRLAERGVGGCVVLGDPAWYGRFGFASQPGLVYPGVPAEHFMALALQGPAPVGVVAYHHAFAVPG